MARSTVAELEAKARGARLARLEAFALPPGSTRDRLLRQARLDLLEVQDSARSLRTRDEARAHFERVYGPDLRRAPLALRTALQDGPDGRGIKERWPGHDGNDAA